MTDFPILDTDRGDTEGRVVLTENGLIEPYIDELDSWCWMPLRVAIGCSGLQLEIGPYTLDEFSIKRLRQAISAYDLAKHGPTIRRIQ